MRRVSRSDTTIAAFKLPGHTKRDGTLKANGTRATLRPWLIGNPGVLYVPKHLLRACDRVGTSLHRTMFGQNALCGAAQRTAF
jgi:hypothetical protein